MTREKLEKAHKREISRLTASAEAAVSDEKSVWKIKVDKLRKDLERKQKVKALHDLTLCMCTIGAEEGEGLTRPYLVYVWRCTPGAQVERGGPDRTPVCAGAGRQPRGRYRCVL